MVALLRWLPDPTPLGLRLPNHTIERRNTCRLEDLLALRQGADRAAAHSCIGPVRRSGCVAFPALGLAKDLPQIGGWEDGTSNDRDTATQLGRCCHHRLWWEGPRRQRGLLHRD